MADTPEFTVGPVGNAKDDKRKEIEYREVKQLREEYEQARKFDKEARKQYAKDRLYAAGKADPSWAVDTNLIGNFIEILVAFLYARNPDVSVRKAEQVDNNNSQDAEAFAKTLELVISRLWQKGRLKKAAKKLVRSALAVGPGWLKVIFVTDKRTDPQVQAALNDARDNLARLQARQRELAEGNVQDIELKQREIERTIQGLEAQVEVIVRRGLAIDFCRAEDVQVSLDVADLEDYLEAGWISDATYKPKSELRELFPRLTEELARMATCYYQRQPQPASGADLLSVTERDAEQYYVASSGGGAENGIEYARIIELWDRRDNLIKTWVEGVPCWAKDPYPPPQASSRFYPYFLLGFFWVDGERHPQSLSWRLRKLQDEYASVRSNFRITRQRSIPGTMFNAGQVSKENARKLECGTEQEYIPINPTNPHVDLRTLFAEKPIARVDPLLYDVTPVLRDMEKIAGVQESLQASVVQPKTATEAEIQQGGFAARSSADRDTLEDLLDELALYTAEVALQTLTVEEVQRMVGPQAFWPAGMDIEDLLTLVEVEIAAGTTGKPNTAAERESWSVVLPLIRETMVQIQQAQAQGNMPLAQALIELLRETLNRMGDRIDVERFIPQLPAMPAAPASADAAPVPGADPGLPVDPTAAPDPAAAIAGAAPPVTAIPPEAAVAATT